MLYDLKIPTGFAKKWVRRNLHNLFDVNILQFLKEMRREEVIFFRISVHFDHWPVQIIANL